MPYGAISAGLKVASAAAKKRKANEAKLKKDRGLKKKLTVSKTKRKATKRKKHGCD